MTDEAKTQSLDELIESLGVENRPDVYSLLMAAARAQQARVESGAAREDVAETCPFREPLGQLLEMASSEGIASAALPARAQRYCCVCGGSRSESYRRDEYGYEWPVKCKGDGMDARIGLHNAAGLPGGDLLGASFERWRARGEGVDEVVARVERWAHEFKPGDLGLWISGSYGTGKSHLASAIARVATLERGIPSRWVRLSRLLRELRSSYSDGERSEDAILAPLISARLLVLDDVGERVTEHEARIFSTIVCERVERDGLTTIVTSNYTPTALRRELGGSKAIGGMDRAISRLIRLCKVAKIEATDYRAETAL